MVGFVFVALANMKRLCCDSTVGRASALPTDAPGSIPGNVLFRFPVDRRRNPGVQKFKITEFHKLQKFRITKLLKLKFLKIMKIVKKYEKKYQKKPK